MISRDVSTLVDVCVFVSGHVFMLRAGARVRVLEYDGPRVLARFRLSPYRAALESWMPRAALELGPLT
jgi:transposase